MSGDVIYFEAIERFQNLREQVQALDLAEPDAMTLATSTLDGHPTSRVVLLRGFDERGFSYYTNSKSRKGQQLEQNNRVALCFYWDAIGEQVRVEGKTEHLTETENNAYWSRRSRASQIASAASEQSEILADRNLYLEKVQQLESEFAGAPVPRPVHWIGYRVIPNRIEFWQSRPARMHERTVYLENENGWSKMLLYP